MHYCAIANPSASASEAIDGSPEDLQTQQTDEKQKLKSVHLLPSPRLQQSQSTTSLRIRSQTFDSGASPTAAHALGGHKSDQKDERERDRASSASSGGSPRKTSGGSGRASNSSGNLLTPDFGGGAGAGCSYNTPTASPRRLSAVPPTSSDRSTDSSESLRRKSLMPQIVLESERQASENNMISPSSTPLKRSQPQLHLPLAIPVINLVEDSDGGRTPGSNCGNSPSHEVPSAGSVRVTLITSPKSQMRTAAYRERKTPTWDTPVGPAAHRRPTPAPRALSEAAAGMNVEHSAFTPAKSPHRSQQVQKTFDADALGATPAIPNRETRSTTPRKCSVNNNNSTQENKERENISKPYDTKSNFHNGVQELPLPRSPVCVSKSFGSYGQKSQQQQRPPPQQQHKNAAVGVRRGAAPLQLNLMGFSTSNDSNESPPAAGSVRTGTHFAMDRARSFDSAASENNRMADTSSLDSEDVVMMPPAPRHQLMPGTMNTNADAAHMVRSRSPAPRIGYSADRCDSGYRSQDTTTALSGTCATSSFSSSFQSFSSRAGPHISGAHSFEHAPEFKGKKTASTKRRLFVARGRLARGSAHHVTLEGPNEESEHSSSISAASLGDADGDCDVDELQLTSQMLTASLNPQTQVSHQLSGGSSGSAIYSGKRMLPQVPDLQARVLSPDVPLDAKLHAISRSPRRSLNITDEKTSPTTSQLQWPMQSRECPKSSPTRRKLPTIPCQQHGPDTQNQQQILGTTASSPGAREQHTPTFSLSSASPSPTQRSPRETSPHSYSRERQSHSQQQRQPSPSVQMEATALMPQYRHTYELAKSYSATNETGSLLCAATFNETRLHVTAFGGGIGAEGGLQRQWTLQVPGAAPVAIAATSSLSSEPFGTLNPPEPRTNRLGSYYGAELLDPVAQQSLLNRLRSHSFDVGRV